MNFDIAPVESWLETIKNDFRDIFIKLAPESWRIFVKRILIVCGIQFETAD